MSNTIKIVSDGTPIGTKIYNHEGREIIGVTELRIHPLFVESGFVSASLEFVGVELEILANWDRHPLRLWANRKVGK